MTFRPTESEAMELQARLRKARQGGVSEPKRQPQAKHASETEHPALTVELPIPPSVNALYCNVPGKGRVLTKKGREYKKVAVSLISGIAMQQRFRVPDDVRLSVSITFYFADYRRDLDDALKALIDCFAAALSFNDNRVDNLEILRGEADKSHPRCLAVLSILGK
jgi:Holliday junction resolvase RusA-like endonuclease